MSAPYTMADLTDDEAEIVRLALRLTPERRRALIEYGRLLGALNKAEKSGVGIAEAIEALSVFANGPYGSEGMRKDVAELRAKHARPAPPSASDR